MDTKILKCTCSHPFQDKKHGKQRRVHNICKHKGAGPPRWRCTVCSNEKE